mmetsp:Transcript_38778/g.89695  ORF Transcript_38778/g.89695 Transcript_38778/m.89695 type:complete len:166 (+) Transcript_38778:315-812(+)
MPCQEDGSYPLCWTELHEEYCALFERQLKAVVQEEGFSVEDFRDHIGELTEFAASKAPDEYLPGCEPSYIPPSPGIRVADFWEFLEALTASKSFDSFREVMSVAAQRPKQSLAEGRPWEGRGYTAATAAEGYDSTVNTADELHLLYLSQEVQVANPGPRPLDPLD